MKPEITYFEKHTANGRILSIYLPECITMYELSRDT